MLEARQLACLKGDRLLFRDVSAQIAAGELWRVAGANGAGKTSLLRILCGLAQPEHGEVLFRGESIRRAREPFHQSLLYIGHAPALHALLTPLETLRFACASAGQQLDEEAALAALARVGLAAQAQLPNHVLSQGQRRRVGLSRLFVSAQRPLWVLDEPFTALDVHAVADMASTLDAHCAAGGAVIMTTHQDAPFARAPQVLELKGGDAW